MNKDLPHVPDPVDTLHIKEETIVSQRTDELHVAPKRPTNIFFFNLISFNVVTKKN